MKKPEIYEVETRESTTEVFGVSIEDVKEFVENNKDKFDLDMNGYFKVNTSSNDYQIDVEIINLYGVKSIDIRNITNGTNKLNALYTSNAELFLVTENKKKLLKISTLWNLIKARTKRCLNMQ